MDSFKKIYMSRIHYGILWPIVSEYMILFDLKGKYKRTTIEQNLVRFDRFGRTCPNVTINTQQCLQNITSFCI